MDDQTRTHCMLDLDKVDDAPSADWFVRKWRKELREELQSEYLADAKDRIDEAETDANDADRRLQEAQKTVRTIQSEIENLSAQEATPNDIADKLDSWAERLEECL